EDGIRDLIVTGVQTCALPIYILDPVRGYRGRWRRRLDPGFARGRPERRSPKREFSGLFADRWRQDFAARRARLRRCREGDDARQIGRASCRERGWVSEGEGGV